MPTVTDIIGELDKPGRDPRPEFKTATFKEGVEKISDLVPEMVLEGGHQRHQLRRLRRHRRPSGWLVHISSLTDRFVKDPREVVKAGDIVRVKVLEVDVPRKRISLTMRLDEKAGQPARKPAEPRTPATPDRNMAPRQSAPTEGAMGNAFAAAPRNEEISPQNAKSPERAFHEPHRQGGIKRPDSAPGEEVGLTALLIVPGNHLVSIVHPKHRAGLGGFLPEGHQILAGLASLPEGGRATQILSCDDGSSGSQRGGTHLLHLGDGRCRDPREWSPCR